MRILIVEDVVKLADALKRGLEAEGYAVDVLHDGLAARRRLRARGEPGLPYDLVVLDVMLPGVDGFTLCQEMRDRGLTVPVLMLTARDAVSDRVTGLDSGADDYLVKPFAFEELLARLRTLLRRPRAALPPTLQVGDLELDPAAHEARRGGQRLSLSAKEFSLLELFMRHPGRGADARPHPRSRVGRGVRLVLEHRRRVRCATAPQDRRARGAEPHPHHARGRLRAAPGRRWLSAAPPTCSPARSCAWRCCSRVSSSPWSSSQASSCT